MNTVNRAIVAVACIAAVLSVAPARAALIAQYGFASNANNSVGREHGLLMGDATIIDDPVMGSVLSLDGDGDYVMFSDLLITTGEFTITAWANQLGQAGGKNNSNIIFSQRGPSVDDPAITIYSEMQGNDPIAASQLRSSVGTRQDLRGSQIPYGQWHHYALTVSVDTMTLYVDGEQVASLANNQQGNYYSNVDTIEIGRHSYIVPDLGLRDGGFFNGMIDDVRIYNFAMTAHELNTMVIPEPSCLALLACGAVALVRKRR